MKLFKRKSVRKIKSEMNRIKIEMDKLYITPFMPKENFILWNDYNSILKGLEWVLKERESL